MNWLECIKFNDDGLIPAIAQDHLSKRVLMVAWMNAESLKLTAETKTAVYFSRSRQKLWKKGETSGHIQQVHSIRLDCDADVILLSITQIGGIACHTGRKSCFYRELDLSTDEPTWHVTDPVIKDPSQIYSGSQSHKCHHTDEHSATIKNINPADSVNDSVEAKHILNELDCILAERKNADPSSSYVASLYAKGLNKILEKVGEESVETVISAKDYQTALSGFSTDKSTRESSDQAHKQSKSIAELQNDLVYEIADVWFHTMVTLAWFDMSSDVVLAELSRRFGLSGIAEKAARNQS